MQKYYLLSLLILSVVIPMMQSSNPKVADGLKKTHRYMFLMLAIWGFGIIYVYWRLPE